MTLEKLLIFGFGLAVAAAITIAAARITDDRAPEYQGYTSKVTDMIDKTR